MPLPVSDVEVGNEVLVWKFYEGKSRWLHAIVTVCEVRKTKFSVLTYGSFGLKTGLQWGGSGKFTLFVTLPTSNELKEARAELERRDQEAEKAAEDKKRTEYDALPESVNLARKLDFFCNVNGEMTIARMPIEILRAAVGWIEANNLECE